MAPQQGPNPAAVDLEALWEPIEAEIVRRFEAWPEGFGNTFTDFLDELNDRLIARLFPDRRGDQQPVRRPTRL